MLFIDNERQAQAKAIAGAENMVLEELPVVLAVRYGSPGSNGDAGDGHKTGTDGNTTAWFKVGEAVGSAPVKPARY